jgi:hypothetical protein
VNATIDCGNGAIGPFIATEVEGTTTVIGGRAAATYGSCRWSGHFGGVRRVANPQTTR